MTRDELLVECFGRSDFPTPIREHTMRDEATSDVQAYLAVYLPRLRVRADARGPIGDGVVEGATTLTVARLARLCTDPAYRGKGYAAALVRRAHTELAENRPISFAVVWLPERDGDAEALLDRLGYAPAPAGPAGLWVRPLRDEAWPGGRVSLLGEWD